MNEPIVSIFDIETDDIDAKVIRCLSFYDVNTKISATITDYNVMRKYFQRENVYYCGHHIIGFDIPVVERLLGIKVTNPLIDTLSLSWTLSSNRNSHGLQSYGDEYGIEKPKIDDYANQDIEEIKRRCSQDVLINLKVWENQKWYLNELYDGDWEQILKYIAYLTFKLQCVAKQQELGVKLDIPLIKETLMELEDLKVNKIEVLTAAMPKQPIKTIKKYPKVFKKANGELSANGVKWIELVKEKGLPDDYTGDIEVITGYNDANPNSHAQIKDWLFSLGWEPDYYKYVKEEGKSEMRKIPQVASKDEPGELSISVKKLIEKEPKLEELSSLGIISHRISIFKGFLRDQKDGRIYQGISGITPTLRSQHTGLVNLPIPSKPFAKNIRKSIIVSNENNVFLGVDLVSIEAKTRNHFMFPFDKEYVNELENGIDSHIDISIKAGLITEEDGEFYSNFNKDTASKEDVERYNMIKKARASGKTVNFAALYGVAKATLSRNSGMSVKQCEKLLEVYWERNKAVKQAVETFKTKQIGSQLWVQNPISKYWLSVRNSKDLFSVVNQNSSTLCFDTFCKYLIRTGIQIPYFYHDEWLGEFDKKDIPQIKEKIEWSINKVNKELQLNVVIQHSLQEGVTYADCH